MPLYEFRCESCGWTMETIQAFSDPIPGKCEACGGALKKLLSAPAVQFKGSGFYLTDYGRSGSSARSEAKSGDASAGEAKKTEPAKPAADSSPAKGSSPAPKGDS